MNLLLASSSPRRKMLLENLGFNLKIVSPEIDEAPLPGEAPRDLVFRLSQKKARTVSVDSDLIVLAADTVVVCQNQLLGKPKGRDEAKQFLKKLSGKSHQVLTGYTILKDKYQFSHIVTTQVFFRSLKEYEIDAYVLTREPYDKAGGYAVQGSAAAFIDSIEGSFTNIIGLPMKEVLESLEQISHG
jgi:septum formation protein